MFGRISAGAGDPAGRLTWPLISYGVSYQIAYRRVGTANRLAPDLPAEQPSKFRLIINVKTAKTLGLNVPPVIMAEADESHAARLRGLPTFHTHTINSDFENERL